MPQDTCPMIRAGYKQSSPEANRAVQAALIAPLYLCMIAGTGGVYTPANIQRFWANQPNPMIEIRGLHAKRNQIFSVSEHLIQIREMFGLTMTEMAQIFRVSRPTAYSWINGVDPKEQEAKALISKLGGYADTFRNAGITNVHTLARQPISNGQSLIDLFKLGKDVRDEIASVRFTAAKTTGQSRVKRDFGPASKTRRVRPDEISVPLAINPEDNA